MRHQKVRRREKDKKLVREGLSGVKQSGAEELLHATEGLVRQCGGLMRLLAPQDMMMTMMISIIITFQFICLPDLNKQLLVCASLRRRSYKVSKQ